MRMPMRLMLEAGVCPSVAKTDTCKSDERAQRLVEMVQTFKVIKLDMQHSHIATDFPLSVPLALLLQERLKSALWRRNTNLFVKLDHFNPATLFEAALQSWRDKHPDSSALLTMAISKLKPA